MAGDGLVRPMNAPGGGQPVPGVQPGDKGLVIANVVVVAGKNGRLLVYSGTPALGNLIASISAVDGTDNFGNVIIAGITAYQPNGSGGHLALSKLQNGNVDVSSSDTSSLGGMSTTGATGPGRSTLALATEAYSGDVANTLSLESANQGGNALWSGQGGVTFGSVVGTTATVNTDAKGYVDYAISNASDTNVYNAGKACVTFAGSTPINSVAFTTILSLNVLSGQKYRFKAMVHYVGDQNAGAAVLSLAHPNTNTYTSIQQRTFWLANGGSPIGQDSTTFIDVNSPTLTVGNWVWEIDGWFQPSASQNITIAAACSVAIDTYHITRAMLEISPVEG